MTLYVRQRNRFTPASDSDVLSAYGRLMAARRRTSGPPPKLTREQMAEVRERAAAGEDKPKLAAEFGVSRQTIYRYLTMGSS